MKALGVLESKWDPIRKKLVRRLLEEQDQVLWSSHNLSDHSDKYVAQDGPGNTARFEKPYLLALDNTGCLLVAEEEREDTLRVVEY